MSQYYLYQAPLPKQLISFPITLFDGTKSMKREYTSIIQIYEEVFNDFDQSERQQYQWTKGINLINPFIGADFGDLTQSMRQIFLTLLTNQYPQYLAIILVTDGGESLDSESLQNQIQQIKSKYFIQFITIVITEQQQPIKIMKQLNALFKSENIDFKSQYIIKRSSRKSILQIQNDFREAFSKIKQQLVVYKQKDILNQKVSTIINQSKLIDEVTPGTLFLAEKGLEISTENGKVQNTTQISHILQILQKSFLNTLQKMAKLTSSELKNECSEILRVINDFLSQANKNDNKSDEYQAIQLILKIITSIINNTYNWQSIDTQLFDDLFVAVSNAKVNQLTQLTLINQSECCVENINQINQQMITKFENILNNSKTQLDFLIKQENIILDTLKIYVELFSTEVKYLQDQKSYLKKLVLLLQNQLSIVFQQQKFEDVIKAQEFNDISQSNFEYVQQLFKLNYIIKQLIQIEYSSEYILFSLNQLIKLQGNSNNQQPENVLIFYKDLNELPFIKQLKPNDDLEDRESIFVLLINMNDSMKLDIENLLQSYQQGFKEIQNSKKIELVYTNKKENNEQIIQEFCFLNEKQQQNNRFTSLIELFEKNQEKFQLKQKKINIGIITDDEQNYWKLHLQIQMLELSQYYVKLIYVALGLGFYIFISAEIEQFAKQFFQGQKPFLFNIPKNKQIQYQKKKEVDKFQLKIFEEIAKKFKGNKL